MVLALVAVVALAACTGSENRDAPTGSPSPEAPDPVEGGVVRVGVIGEPATFDPYSARASDLTYAVVRPVYPSLWRFAPDGTPEPDLVDDVEVLDGGLRVTLRAARWSDGRRVTAWDVVGSADRARKPSGFAGLHVRAVDAQTVEFRGSEHDWERRLARLTFVMPRGEASRGIGGRFTMEVTPGLKVTYTANPAWGDVEPSLDRVQVFFVEYFDILLELLKRGRLDVIAPPSAVNFDERLDEMGVQHAEALGWERIYIDQQGADATVRDVMEATIDLDVIEESFLRDDGRPATTLYPGPYDVEGPWEGLGVGSEIRGLRFTLAVPAGDELLELLQRYLHRELASSGNAAELVTTDARTFYGAWEESDPMDVALRRAAGAPGLGDDGRVFRYKSELPVAHVETVVAWRDGVVGPAPNPTFEGLLWNLEEWFQTDPG